MFYIPHYHYHVEEWSQIKEATLTAIYNRYNTELQSELGKNERIHTTYFKRDETNGAEFELFISIIVPYLQKVNEENSGLKFYGEQTLTNITDIWYQVQNHCEYHSIHNHGTEGWSAVFYADYDPLVHEATKFYCPMVSDKTGNIHTFQPNVQEGDLIVFPSQINHESIVNRSNKPRSIISFNIR